MAVVVFLELTHKYQVAAKLTNLVDRDLKETYIHIVRT